MTPVILETVNESLGAYGFSTLGSVLLNEKERATGVDLAYKRGRLYFLDSKGRKLFSCAPENAGDFLKAFWFREKIA